MNNIDTLNQTFRSIAKLGFKINILQKGTTIAFLKDKTPQFILVKHNKEWELEVCGYILNKQELVLICTLIQELENKEKTL